jgi:hypothetical protein
VEPRRYQHPVSPCTHICASYLACQHSYHIVLEHTAEATSPDGEADTGHDQHPLFISFHPRVDHWTYGEKDTKPVFSRGNQTFESIKCVAVVKSMNHTLLIS